MLWKDIRDFFKIYDYRHDEDKMSVLHAKVISVDQNDTCYVR